MKKLILLIALIAIISVTHSCKKKDNIDEEHHVVMLAIGNTFDDLSFLESCKNGLERAQSDFNLYTSYDIDTSTSNYYERIEYYCDQQYDLVIAIGYMWADAIDKASEKYTNINFIIVDTELTTVHTNAASIAFEVDEAAFPLGFLAAWWADINDTISPKTGYVGAMNIPQIRQFSEPFNNGVTHYNTQYNRNVDTAGCYAGQFFDFDLGKHLSDSLIETGTDVIFGIGSETGNGALLGARDRNKVGIGVDVDQFYSYPVVSNILLSSAMKKLDVAIYGVIEKYIDGSFPGAGVYRGRLSNFGVDIAPYHDFDSQIPDSIKSNIESIKTGIINGSISTGWK